MTGMQVAPMRWWHLEAAHRLEEQLFPHDCWSMEQFWGELAQPTRSYFVAVDDDDRVLGYAGLFATAPDGDVQTIAVDSHSQGQGVGRALLQRLIDEAVALGCTRILLEVRAGNAAARGLYERAGFEAISTRRAYYPDGEDALILEWKQGQP